VADEAIKKFVSNNVAKDKDDEEKVKQALVTKFENHRKQYKVTSLQLFQVQMHIVVMSFYMGPAGPAQIRSAEFKCHRGSLNRAATCTFSS
jgi:hypothetical protein